MSTDPELLRQSLASLPFVVERAQKLQKIQRNAPKHAGSPACAGRVIFGPLSRYALRPFHGVDGLVWHVLDAESIDPTSTTGMATVAEAASPEEALEVMRARFASSLDLEHL